MYLIERKPTLSDFFGIAVKTTSRQASGLSVSHPPKRTRNRRYSNRRVDQLRARTISTTTPSDPGPPLSDNEEGPLLVLLLVFSSTDNLSITGPSFESIFSSIRFSRRSIIEPTFVSMHALKRSAARSKRAAISTLSSSDPG